MCMENPQNQMEAADSVNQEDTNFDVEFDFEDFDFELMENLPLELPPADLQQEKSGNASSNEHTELVSSSGSNQSLINPTNSNQNFTGFTMASSVPSDSPLEQPAASFAPPLAETPETHCPIPIASGNPTSEIVGAASLQQWEPCSFNTEVYAELRPEAGTNWSDVNNENSNQNLKQSALSALECSNTPLAAAPNVGMLAHDGGQQPFQAEVISSKQLLNAQPENVPQTEHMPLPQSKCPLSEYSTNYQKGKNIPSNNFSSLNYLKPLLPALRPQNMGMEGANQVPLTTSPQWSTFIRRNQNTSYVPIAPKGSQANEFMTTNAYDPQGANFTQPQTYSLSRPPQSSSESQPLDQVPNPANVYDPQRQYSMQASLSMPLRPRHFSCLQYDQQGYKPMLPEHCLMARSTQLGNYYQQSNQGWTTLNSALPGSSMPSRLEQLGVHQRQDPSANMMFNVMNPQLGSCSMPSESVMPAGDSQLMDRFDQPNQLPLTPFRVDQQPHNSTAAEPALQPWFQRLSNHQQLQQLQLQDSQFRSSLQPLPSMFSWSQPYTMRPLGTRSLDSATGLEPDENIIPDSPTPFGGLQHFQTSTQSNPYRTALTSAQEIQLMNSQAGREIANLRNKMPIPDIRGPPLPSARGKAPVQENKRAARESPALSSKRTRRETAREGRSLLPPGPLSESGTLTESGPLLEAGPLPESGSLPESGTLPESGSLAESGLLPEDKTSKSEGNEAQSSFLLDPAEIRWDGTNTVYDPFYEGIGLPVDPHLRLFGSS